MGLLLSNDRRTITGHFLCGGKLTATEARRTITLTYVASSVGPGAMACALVPLSVRLPAAVTSGMTIVDGVTGKRLRTVGA